MSYVLTDDEYAEFRRMLQERAGQREPGIVYRPGIGKTNMQRVRRPAVVTPGRKAPRTGVHINCDLITPVIASLGSPTAPPDITYVIKLNGTTYPGALPPEQRTFDKGIVLGPATTGTCYFDSDNVIHLKWADETWKTGPCTPPT